MRGRRLLLAGCLASLLHLAALPSPPWRSLRPGVIATVAGGRALPASLPADGLALYGVTGLAADLVSGDLYAIDTARGMVFRVATDPGTGETTVEPWAGTGMAGFDGDGRPALETSLHAPSALALDPRTGELFIADTWSHRVRAASADGRQVRTVAGLGVRGIDPELLPSETPNPEAIARGHFSGDGGPAVDAELNYPSGVAADGLGLLFIADSGNHRVRVVNRGTSPVVICAVEVQPGAIATVAGTGAAGFAGDGGQARAARLSFPTELDLDATGNVFVLDTGNGRVRKIDRLTGVIRTVAGGQRPRQPPSAQSSIAGLAITSRQELVYADRVDGSLHIVDRGGEDRVIFTAHPGEALLGSVTVGRGDRLYVADQAHHRILEVSGGKSTTLAGGAVAPSRVPLKEAEFAELGPVAVDAFGNVFLADAANHAVRRILMAERVVETLMGTGSPGSGGDGGPPQLAELTRPAHVMLDGDWSFLVTDQHANRVRRVSMSQDGLRVATFAGDRGVSGLAPDRPADAARLAGPVHAARHPTSGELYISCEADHTLRKVDAGGRLSIVAGTGDPGFAGDGGEARAARLHGPAAIAFDRAGNLYLADQGNHRIRWIDDQGRIRTFAGTGARGYTGDGGPAAAADLNHPDGLLFDGDGNLYFADTDNHCVRRIDAASRRIETVVGNGLRGYAGDGGPARQARLNLPRGLALSRDGFLYITDSLNRRLRAVKLPI